MCNTLLIIKML